MGVSGSIGGDVDDVERNPIASVFARADDASRPGVRGIFNYIASKICPLSEREIRHLSDDKIAVLLNTELSRLSGADKYNLLDTDLSHLITIANSITHLLASDHDDEITSLLSNGSSEILNLLFDFPGVSTFFHKLFLYGACYFGVMFTIFIGQILHLGLFSSKSTNSTLTTSNPIAQQRLRYAKRSVFLSRYTRNPLMKGFKGIGEMFSQELLSDVTREVEPTSGRHI